MYADLCAAYGIELPSLAAATKARLKELLPDFAQPDNPLDLTGAGFLHGMDEIVRTLIADPNLDIIAPLSIAPAHADDTLAHHLNASFLACLASSPKPLVPVVFREIGDYAREYFHSRAVPYIEHPAVGFKAVAHLIQYAAFLRQAGISD